MKLLRYDAYMLSCPEDDGKVVLYSDAEALEARNKELEEENARLHVRLNLLAGKCDTCGEVCEDSILEHWIEKAKSLEKENEELRKTVAYVIEKQFCTIDELGTKLENAWEKTK